MRLPIPIENSYDSTRVGTDEQRTVNMYRHSQRGWRQFPGLVEFTDFSNTVTHKDTSATLETINSLPANNDYAASIFNSDGTKMYTNLDTNGTGEDGYSYEWALSTPYDVSTLSFTAKFDSTDAGIGFEWSDDGSKYLTATGSSGSYGVYEQTVSTPYDPMTRSGGSQESFLSKTSSSVFAARYSSDGLKLFVLDSVGGSVDMYILSTAFDVLGMAASATRDATFDYTGAIAAGEANCVGMAFSGTGELMLLSNRAGAQVEVFNLSTAWDVTTASVGTPFDVSSETTQPGWVEFANEDSVILVSDHYDYTTTEKVFRYNAILLGTDGAVGRGAINMDGLLYTVVGAFLYSVNSSGVLAEIGAIAGSERVVMETDGVQLVITTGTSGGTIYRYTVAGGLDIVVDADVEDTAKSSAYLDLAFYLDQEDGNFIASANNDATSYSNDDKIEAESFADDILRMFAHNQLLYAMGATTTEIWYTSGVGRPPVDRQQVIERGVIGTHAVDSIDDTIYFVDQFTRPNMMSGLQYEPIYSPAIAERWGSYTTTTDCFVTAYTHNQQNFVDFVFPTENQSWTYNANSREWCEREDTSQNRFRIIEYVNVYDQLLGVDRADAKMYTLSETTYTDDGVSITRTKDTGLITSDIYGDANVLGNDMICNSLKITTESTGAATLTITFSKDGAAFGQSRTMTLTAGRQTRELNAWGKFREGIFRITTTSNAGVDIVDLSADLEVID